MKKIKSIRQLRTRKEHVNLRLNYLEHTMQQQWKELKQELKPAVIIKDSIGTLLRKKTAPDFVNGGILKSVLTYGVSLLAGKLADKAGEKFSRVFKK
jgi:hypothetical protein